jgi:hypothetical protein
MKDDREYARTPFSAPVKVVHPEFGELTFKMRDMSNGGVFLLTGNELPLPKGEIVQIQVQGMLADAPLLDAEIIRKDEEGTALKFCDIDIE